MSSIATVLLYVAIAGVVLYRVVYKQVRGTLLDRRSLVTLPLLLVVVGGYLTLKALPGASAAALGFRRSTTTTLTAREGTTFQKGSAVTIGLWVLTIGVRIGLVALATVLGVAGPLSSASIALTVGVSIAVQNATTYRRIQLAGLPLADRGAVRVSR